LKWAGYVWRADESLLRNVLNRTPTGKPCQRLGEKGYFRISDIDESTEIDNNSMDPDVGGEVW